MREPVYPKVCCHEWCGQQKGEETRKCAMELRGNKNGKREFKSINKDRDLRRGNGRRSIFYAELLKCEEEEITER